MKDLSRELYETSKDIKLLLEALECLEDLYELFKDDLTVESFEEISNLLKRTEHLR